MNTFEKSLPGVEKLYLALKGEFTPTQWRSYEAAVGLFLSEVPTHLRNAKMVSSSTLSRLLNQYQQTEQLEAHLWRFQVEALKSHVRRLRGRKPWMVIRVDLTSIAKTGKKLPYLRVYNGVKGIHLVVMHVSIGKLSFPMGYAIYDPEREETPIQLAFKLICKLAPCQWPEVYPYVVMDSGFYSAEMVDALRGAGFKHISVGGKSNLRLQDGRLLRDAGRGEQVELETLPGTKLYHSWVDLPRDGKMKRFHVLDTQPGTARTLVTRHKRRWLIESFFKSAKYDFGLQETRLRTKTGIKNWLLLVWLSTSLALYQQCLAGMTSAKRPAWKLTLVEAAELVRDLLLPFWFENSLLMVRHRRKELFNPSHTADLSKAA